MSHLHFSRQTKQRQKQWAERKALGLCVHCGINPKFQNNIACQVCAAKKNKTLKKHQLKLKLDAFEAYGGVICSCLSCPERLNPKISFLTLNHIGGGGTKHRASLGGKRIAGGGVGAAGQETYRWVKKNGYPPGFNVLCWNCQWGVHINKGVCPHKG
jgi:hypothetical protein